MKTLIIYLDNSKQRVRKITPSEAFYQDKDGRPVRPDWRTLAIALTGGRYHSFIVLE